MLDQREIHKLRAMLKGEDQRLPGVFAVLGDPRRCLIFRGFLKQERLCVSDVARAHNISMSLASQHLKTLEQEGLVVREKEGRTVYFSPNTADELVRAIIKAVE